MQIDTYAENDRQAIAQLFDEFQDYLVGMDPLGRLQRPAGYGEAALASTLKDVAAHNGEFYLAREGQRVVGFVVAVVLPPLSTYDVGVIPARRGRITQLFVTAAYRNRGIGRMLVTRAEKHLIDQGCQYMRVEVFAPNTNAQAFYKRLGYQDYDVDLIKRAGG